MNVVCVNFHLAFSYRCQRRKGRGRVVRMEHEIRIFVKWARRRIRTVGVNSDRTRISSVICVDWGQFRSREVGHGEGM